MNYEPFFDDIMQRNKDTILSTLRSRVDAIFGGDSKASPDDRDNIALLFTGSRGGISTSQAIQIKAYVTDLYRWLERHGEISKETLEFVEGLSVDDVMSFGNFEFSFFGSLDSILNFIDLVYRKRAYMRRCRQSPVKTIAILAWYGVGVAEMPTLTIGDMSDRNHSINTISKEIVLSQEHYKVLKKSVTEDSDRWSSSDRLLRNRKSSVMTPASIRQALKAFNVYGSELGKVLHCSDIARSGFMSRIKEGTECTGREPGDVIRDMIPGIERRRVYSIVVLYRHWLEAFYETN